MHMAPLPGRVLELILQLFRTFYCPSVFQDPVHYSIPLSLRDDSQKVLSHMQRPHPPYRTVSTQATSRGTVVVADISPDERLALSRLWGPSPRILLPSSERWSANSFNQRGAREMLVNSDLAVTFQPPREQIITSDWRG